MTLRRDTILNNRYIVRRMLGEGATGAVYLVRDNRFKGRSWAVKELQVEGLSAEDGAIFRELFVQEAKITRELDHRGLPRIEDFFIENNRYYLVMDRVEGPTLEEILRESPRPLTQEDVHPWALQICAVLRYLHSRTPPVIFRDLKPANVMLTRSGEIKLIDLGIARFFNPRKPTDTHVMGTPGFCPPEQYRGHTDARSDIYAFGSTLYHLLTKQDVEKLAFRFPPLRTFNPAVSPAFEAAIARCLEVDPNRRFADAAQLEGALQAMRPGYAPSLLDRLMGLRRKKP